MKKLISFLLIGILSVSLWSCSDDDDDDYRPDQVISYDKIPDAAKNFISSHFPEDQVIRVEKEVEHTGAEYDVILKSGTEVEFNAAGEWISVDAAYGKAVPAAIVPQQIADYVNANYPSIIINEISKGIPAWEIELSNGLEISFSSSFEVIRIDR